MWSLQVLENSILMSVRTLYTQLCFTGYVDKLLQILFDQVVVNPAVYKELLDRIDVPPSLRSNYTWPDKSDAVASYVSRFRNDA